MVQVCTVAGYAEQRATCLDTVLRTIGIDGLEPDSHTLYPHMTCVALHVIPHLSKQTITSQTDNLDLQSEVGRINKAEGLVKDQTYYGIS